MARNPGRPKKEDGPSFPREELDRLLVHGEEVETDDGESTTVHYPSYRELAERFNISRSLVARYSQQHNCMNRRKQARKRAQALADTKLIELRADELAVSKDDQIRMIDKFLVEFEEALAQGRVRADNPSDFNTMCRLREYLLGGADSRPQVIDGMPSLEELQQRYKEMMDTWERSTPEEREQLPEHLYGFDGASRTRAWSGRGTKPAGSDDTMEN